MTTKTLVCRQCQSQDMFLSGIDHKVRFLLRKLERGRGSVADLAALRDEREQAMASHKEHYLENHSNVA